MAASEQLREEAALFLTKIGCPCNASTLEQDIKKLTFDQRNNVLAETFRQLFYNQLEIENRYHKNPADRKNETVLRSTVVCIDTLALPFYVAELLFADEFPGDDQRGGFVGQIPMPLFKLREAVRETMKGRAPLLLNPKLKAERNHNDEASYAARATCVAAIRMLDEKCGVKINAAAKLLSGELRKAGINYPPSTIRDWSARPPANDPFPQFLEERLKAIHEWPETGENLRKKIIDSATSVVQTLFSKP